MAGRLRSEDVREHRQPFADRGRLVVDDVVDVGPIELEREQGRRGGQDTREAARLSTSLRRFGTAASIGSTKSPTRRVTLSRRPPTKRTGWRTPVAPTSGRSAQS
jgi:hypothetical protein